MKRKNKSALTLVPVHVPSEHLQLIYHTLAEAMKSPPPPEGAATQTVPPTEPVAPPVEQEQVSPPLIDWTDVKTMKRLREGLLKQHLRPELNVQIGIALMDAVAKAALENPPRQVQFDEIYTNAGFTDWDKARSSIGSFTKVLKRVFNLTKQQALDNKPFAPNWGDKGEAHYSMTPEIARAWQSAD